MSNPEPLEPQSMVVPDPPPEVHPEPVNPDHVPAARARRAANVYVEAARRALATNASYLSDGTKAPPSIEAQVTNLTRKMNGLIRLLLAGDVTSDAANAGTPPEVPDDPGGP